ncbi:amidohydrolase family protein [Candidatus Omnitrophota bacterium]
MDKIIDAHIHVYPDAKRPLNTISSNEKLARAIRRYKIDKAIVLPLENEISNEFVRDICRDYFDVFIGFATVNPFCGKKTLPLIDKYIKEYKLRGIKLHPRHQKFSLNDSRVIVLFKKCAKLKIPVIIDAFPGIDYKTGESIPLIIEKIAARIPDVNIVIAHAGGYKVMDALFAAKNQKNIFLDLSFSLQYFKGSSIENDIIFAIKKIGAHRCIYGSDFPEVDMGKSLVFIKRFLKDNNFSNRDKEYILGKTIASLLHL